MQKSATLQNCLSCYTFLEESFKSDLLKKEKREFYCLELNKEKLSEFFKSISSVLGEK